MGSLLAANSNLSGSVHHYRQALIQNSEHSDAYSSLRIVTCYHKYHRSVSTSTEPSPSHMQPTCSKPPTRPREAVFICTKVDFCFLHVFLFRSRKVDLNILWLKFLVFYLTNHVKRTSNVLRRDVSPCCVSCVKSVAWCRQPHSRCWWLLWSTPDWITEIACWSACRLTCYVSSSRS